MCGIAFAHSISGMPVNDLIIGKYQDQKHRGQQGFGVFDGEYSHMVRHSKESGIMKWLTKYPSDTLLFHHRFPTSTINVKRAAHPFSTRAYYDDVQYVLIHNGSIRNAHELFTDHQELGIEYNSFLEDLTFNDSESLAWDFAEYMQGGQNELRAYGNIAFIAMKLEFGTPAKLYFGRNIQPLKMIYDDEGIVLASEGEGTEIDRDTLYEYDFDTKELVSSPLTIRQFKPYVPAASTYQHKTSPEVRNSGFPYRSDNDFTPNSIAAKAAAKSVVHDPEEEERRYQEYWASRDLDSSTGDWLGSMLAHRYPSLAANSDKQTSMVKRTPDYEYDPQTKLILPVTKASKGFSAETVRNVGNGDTLSVALNKEEQRRAASDSFLKAKQNYPTAEEVTTEYMAYLACGNGNFEMAYWAMEADYETLEDAPQTEAYIRAKTLLELVMERISNDPEYKNENSKSTVWEKVWTSKAESL